jgi:predicted dehydrogenase
VILAPQPFHARSAIDCLEAGSHVLVEKPMAVRLDDADAMIEAAGDAGRLIMDDFSRAHLTREALRHNLRFIRDLVQHVPARS